MNDATMSVTAIILAAGKGTRMNSLLPKVLHEVCGRPMLAYVLDACRQAGCRRLIVVVGHEAELVKRALPDPNDEITWVVQDPQRGTGHAVMACSRVLAEISGPVLVVAGDGPLVTARTLRELMATHQARGVHCTLATSILPDPGHYGRVLRDEGGALTGIVEYVEATEAQLAIHEVNVSLYCYDAAALREALGRLTNHNAKGEYYLTDTLALLRSAGKKLAAVAAVPPEEVKSINTIEQLSEVSAHMAARGGGN